MNKQAIDITNYIYSVSIDDAYDKRKIGDKAEIISIASSMLNGGVVDVGTVNKKSVDEIMTSKFRTDENETYYKKIYLLVCGLIRGTIKKDNIKVVLSKDSNLLEDAPKHKLKKIGKLFVLKG